MRSFRFLLFLVLILGGAIQSHAQIDVDIKISRRLYMIYEPLIVTVTVTNRSGRALRFEDTGSHQWFGFDVVRQNGTPVAPRSSSYSLEPLVLESGQKIKRNVNLSPLYPLHSFGMHRIRARVYLAETAEYFVSQPRQIDITEGKLLWTNTVGVPGTRSKRNISLLSHRIPQGDRLYVRIKDDEAGMVYATTKLGRLLSYGAPKVKFDTNNEIHILHKVSPGMYHYFHFSLDGVLRESGSYVKVDKSFPKLRHTTSGEVAVVGGMVSAPVAEAVNNPRPKISDRPAGLPENKVSP